jgi:hypothetical protein
MFFTKDTNLFGKRLNVFRGCFSKPQWTHFKTYLHGLLLGEKGEKNIEDIASNILDGKHQSSLNRFLTKRKWITRKLNAIRLKENIHNRKGGVIALDDMLIEKSGKQMDGVGYPEGSLFWKKQCFLIILFQHFIGMESNVFPCMTN